MMKLLFRNKRGERRAHGQFGVRKPTAIESSHVLTLGRAHADGGRLQTGFLLKKHSRRRWRRLWMVLRDTAFVYYEEQPKDRFAKPMGLMELTSETIVRKATGSKPFVFEIISRPHILTLKAASQDELESWVAKVQHVLDRIRADALAGQQANKHENRRGWLVKRAVRVSPNRVGLNTTHTT
jgi:hypothetical protein